MGAIDPTGMLNKVMQMAEQMTQGSGQCGQGGGQDDPAQFLQILQQLMQQLGQGQEQGQG
jgi:hypothetical protein